jgi:hypothetical protein
MFASRAEEKRSIATVVAHRGRLSDAQVALLVGDQDARTPEQQARMDLITAPFQIRHIQSGKSWAGVAKGDQGLFDLIDKKYCGWAPSKHGGLSYLEGDGAGYFFDDAAGRYEDATDDGWDFQEAA